MPTSNSSETESVNEELSKALRETTSLAQTLLTEISDNATALATLKVQLDSLAGSVSTLSKIIRDGNGSSLVTRLALAEQELINLAKDIDDHIDHDEDFEKEIHARVSNVKDLVALDKKSEKEFNRDRVLGLLKLAVVALPGAIALILKLIE